MIEAGDALRVERAADYVEQNGGNPEFVASLRALARRLLAEAGAGDALEVLAEDERFGGATQTFAASVLKRLGGSR